jgi:hypothetical protein
MHPVRQHLDDLIEHFQRYAEKAEFRRHIDEQMFLLGIEIGQKKRLTTRERLIYLKTFWTAVTFLVAGEAIFITRTGQEAFRKAYAEAVDDWLRNSRTIGKWVESERKHHHLPELHSRWRIDAETRRILVVYLEGISADWPEILPHNEIDAFIDRLENPLDRA